MINSHAPTNGTEQWNEESAVERRLPRKTGVEVDQLRTDRTGKAVWTVGVGNVPSMNRNPTQANPVYTVHTVQEEVSDGNSMVSLQVVDQRDEMLKTSVMNTIEGTWDDMVRPDRYDYYREGHAINRASKVMAKCSLA